ncbi:hypothetical protein N6H13_02895 [Paenibacillus sp. CC-CFT742]|nr:hypothetical protein [Paenibacillus sp. CC-CFT742]MBE7678919.1 hypothetical protein [Paenibacillus sp. P13VS]WJH29740.1 hypothetical protein N6H13_02895 [Paenibacillus sp. CC-CFT742]
METAPDLWWQSLCLDSRWIGIRSIEQIDVFEGLDRLWQSIICIILFYEQGGFVTYGNIAGLVDLGYPWKKRGEKQCITTG